MVNVCYLGATACSLPGRGGVQYRFWSTSHGVTIIFWARSLIRPTVMYSQFAHTYHCCNVGIVPNCPLSKCLRIVCVRLLDGQFSSTHIWMPANSAASSLGHGRAPLVIWSWNWKKKHTMFTFLTLKHSHGLQSYLPYSWPTYSWTQRSKNM